MLFAYLVPGGGHFYLGRRARAIAYFCIVLFMFLVGIAVDGRVYTGGGGSLLGQLATLGTAGAGLPYWIALMASGHGWSTQGDITSITFEHGTAFIISAGLMNLLLVLDAFDITRGRKE
jgi:hypothetical protein